MMTFSATRALFVVSLYVSVCKKRNKIPENRIIEKTSQDANMVRPVYCLMLLMCFIGEDDDKMCVCVCLYNTQTLKDQNIQNLIYIKIRT